MNGLKEYVFKLVLLDLIKSKKNGKEYIVLHGIVPLSNKKKESVLYGTHQCITIFDEFTEDYEQLVAERNKIENVHLTGYFFKDEFKPVSITGYDYKKEK